MPESQGLIGLILSERTKQSKRLLVAIAGPPGSGKSTLTEELVIKLEKRLENGCGFVGMDGYHFDNIVLEQLGLLSRKGTPETFEPRNILADLQRIKRGKEPVTTPIFDRKGDFSRAGAHIIPPEKSVIIIEGNYLLLNRPIWREISQLFDLKIMLSAPKEELQKRLIARWLSYGLSLDEAEKKAINNDMKNVEIVIKESQIPDFIQKNGQSSTQ